MLPTLKPPPRAPHPWEEGAGSSQTAVCDEPAPARVVALPVLAPAPAAADPVICDCLQVRLSTLQGCIARGCASMEALARETGATTVCGGCTPRVAALVNEAAGGFVRLVEVREIRPNVRSFRFEPVDPESNPLRAFTPGQHVVVSGMIAARWVSRPYTLTSPAGDSSRCEITVKLEPDGVLSPWLFLRGPDYHAIHLTPPQGDFAVDLDRPEPVVFLVGGIGVTPALAVARTIAAENRAKRLHIDYSARDAEDLAFREELEDLAAAHPNVTVRFRATRTPGERLGAGDVRRYRRELRQAHFYVCGPERYQDAIRGYLRSAGVRAARVHVESFAPSVRAVPVPPPAPPRPADKPVMAVGVVLLLAYLAQGALGWGWPWLEALQAGESYRRWSGAVLLGFVAAQWILPVLRLRGRLRAAAAAYPWHRWLGALAPAVFYAHATRLGYGFLLALGVVYLANVAVGLADRTIIRDPVRRERYGRVWLVPHVLLACLTVGLAIFHVFVVLAYR